MQTFDKYAEDYRSIHNRNVQGISGADSDYFSRYKIVEMKEMLGNIGYSPRVVLDFGCGDGNSTRYFYEQLGEINYYGIDVSPKSIEHAQGVNSFDTATYSLYDGEHIPYEDNTFDLIFTACVFHHIDREKHLGCLSEIYRVLKPQGLFFIFEHNPYNFLTRKSVRECPFDEGVILIPSSFAKDEMRRTKFEIVKRKYTLFMPRKGVFNKLLGLENYLGWFPMGAQYYIVGRKNLNCY